MISHRICHWIIILILPSTVLLYKDVVFLVDKSSSLSQSDFTQAVDFIYNVTKYITVGPTSTQFSVVTFSSDITERFDLNDHSTNASLLNAISDLKSITPSGSTYTYDALTFARTSSFASSKGSRSNADKVVIVMTDGQSVNMQKTSTEAQLLKNNLNAKVFSIGIGSAVSSSNPELLNMSSDPDSYYAHHVTSYLTLCSLVPSVVPKIDPYTNVKAIPGCPLLASPSTPEDNTLIIVIVAVFAVLAGIGLTILLALLVERKLRGNPAKNQVSHAVRQYDNKTRRGTSKSIFDASALNDPTAREIPQPDDMPSGSGTSNC